MTREYIKIPVTTQSVIQIIDHQRESSIELLKIFVFWVVLLKASYVLLTVAGQQFEDAGAAERRQHRERHVARNFRDRMHRLEAVEGESAGREGHVVDLRWNLVHPGT